MRLFFELLLLASYFCIRLFSPFLIVSENGHFLGLSKRAVPVHRNAFFSCLENSSQKSTSQLLESSTLLWHYYEGDRSAGHSGGPMTYDK